MDGAQFHLLSFLGSNWSRGEPHFSAGHVDAITARIVRSGGLVTWDVPHGPTGWICDSFMRQLEAVGKAVGRIKR